MLLASRSSHTWDATDVLRMVSLGRVAVGRSFRFLAGLRPVVMRPSLQLLQEAPGAADRATLAQAHLVSPQWQERRQIDQHRA